MDERAALVVAVAGRNIGHVRLFLLPRWKWTDLVTRLASKRPKRPLPPQVQTAIAAFLNECQKEAQPFAVAEALGAIRTIFPDLDISDADLDGAISSEAANAGFDIAADDGK